MKNIKLVLSLVVIAIIVCVVVIAMNAKPTVSKSSYNPAENDFRRLKTD